MENRNINLLWNVRFPPVSYIAFYKAEIETCETEDGRLKRACSFQITFTTRQSKANIEPELRLRRVEHASTGNRKYAENGACYQKPSYNYFVYCSSFLTPKLTIARNWYVQCNTTY